MAAAVLFLLLAVPYTLVLIFGAVIEKYLTRFMFFQRQWNKFKPFVDAYNGPYKDNLSVLDWSIALGPYVIHAGISSLGNVWYSYLCYS